MTTLASSQTLITLASDNDDLAILEGIVATNLTASDFGGQTVVSSEPLQFSQGALKDPALGTQLFTEYEAFLSTGQEPEEPVGSTGLGYGNLRFARDLSFGEIYVQIDNIDPAEIVGFHLHCGPPGFLGPILINFDQYGDFEDTISNGQFSARVNNDDVTFVEIIDKVMIPYWV